MELIKGKRVLVTGCCGTVGSEVIRQLIKNEEHRPSSVIGLDNNESELFFIDQEYSNDGLVDFYLCDLRDRDSLLRHMQGVDIVLHTAALKHVVLCERSPMEAVQTNILGVQNVVYAATKANVDRVVFTSSDKAVNPTNVMGTSKLMGERLITAANNNRAGYDTILSSTRFGNVLGSNGSVIPIFRDQIKKGGPVTLTDRDMTRFIMSIQQSVKLVLDSVNIARGGDVLITKMPVIKIKDLAEVMIKKLAPKYGRDPANIEIVEIGAKPGEKLYEELMSDEETRRSVELKDYFSVIPAFKGNGKRNEYCYEDVVSSNVVNPYNSSVEACLSQEELEDFLVKNDLV